MLIHQQGHLEDGIFNFICSNLVPSNIGAFGWRLFLDRLQRKDNLIKQKIGIQGRDNNCEMYQVIPETCSHLFFSCKITYKIQSLCYEWLGFQHVLPVEESSHLRQYVGMVNKKSKRMVWKVIWFTVVQVTWKASLYDWIVEPLRVLICRNVVSVSITLIFYSGQGWLGL